MSEHKACQHVRTMMEPQPQVGSLKQRSHSSSLNLSYLKNILNGFQGNEPQ